MTTWVARATCVALSALTAGCAGTSFVAACGQDADCGEGLVCFVDGCGDPDEGLVVEVTPSARSGLYPQDFRLDALRSAVDLELPPAGMLRGLILRAPAQGGLAAPYDTRVSFRVNGRSALIPGRTRHFQAVVQPHEGTFSVPVGAGIYSVVVASDDITVPPWIAQNVHANPGTASELSVRFDPEPSLLRLEGTLLGVSAPPPQPMEIQALDLDTRLPASQRVAVAADGSFSLWLSAASAARGRVLLQATPREVGAAVPQKSFDVPAVAALPDPLRLGNFGPPLTVAGRVIDTTGAPVVDALVFTAGSVGGGGSYQSPRVRTDAEGAFRLQTLPALPGASLWLYALPPSGARAGTSRTAVPPGFAVAPLSVVCPDRIATSGRLLRSDGSPAAGVLVSAEAEVEGDETVLPLPPTPVQTDSSGEYALALEPGLFRLDFVGTDLPRASRLVRVPQGVPELSLDVITLSRGRRVIGVVRVNPNLTGIATADVVENAPFALVRFFRLDTHNVAPAAALIGEAYADADGRYSVLLPAR